MLRTTKVKMNKEQKRTESSAQLESSGSKKRREAEKYTRLARVAECVVGLLIGAILGAIFADLMRL